MYKCSKCGTLVLVIAGKVIKPCKCDAPVVAEMSASAKGVSSVNKEKAGDTWQDSATSKTS